MKYLPSVIAAVYQDKFIIKLTFDNGVTKAVDFSKWMKGPIFTPLKSVDYFRKFFLDGTTVAWPNGADIAPEALYVAEDVMKPGVTNGSKRFTPTKHTVVA